MSAGVDRQERLAAAYAHCAAIAARHGKSYHLATRLLPVVLYGANHPYGGPAGGDASR